MSALAIIAGVALGVNLLGGITKGFVNAFGGADDQRNQQIAELEYQNKQLEAQKAETQRRFEVAQRESNTQIAQGITDRDTAAAFNAQTGVFTNKQAYEEYNNLRLQATQVQGQAEASIATTGFRRTGTQERRIEQTESQIEKQLDMARDKADLTIASTYLSSADSYNQSTRQIEAYRRQLDEARKQHEYDISTLKTQISENKGTIEALIRERDDPWQGVVDFFSGWF